MAVSWPFTLTRLSDTVFRIHESDKFGENPFIYLVVGENKLVLIDTGCGSADLSQFLRSEVFSRQEIPESVRDKILVINTHNHFDHVGSNYRFSPKEGPKSPFCLDLCASGTDQSYTVEPYNNIGWCCNCTVTPYEITRWLSDGEKVSLSDVDDQNFLQVIHVPGHSPDSIALFYHKEDRLFGGDFIYRWCAILAIGIKSDLDQYLESAKKLVEFESRIQEDTGADMVISCGHIDDNLDGKFLKKFLDFLSDIKAEKIKGTRKTNMITYANRDKDLYFALGHL